MSAFLAALLMLQAAPPSGSISGTVVLAGSQLQTPLIMARVELSGGPMPSQVVRTDAQGRFTFANLQPGSYRLRVTKDSFLRQEYARRAAIVIKPGEPHKPIVIAMERAPTLAGRIQNEGGEPIANILVQAMRGVYGPDGNRTFTTLASTLTDDRGEYRLYWLDPGEYIVSASFVPVVKTPGNPIETVPGAVYAPTFYPKASDIANAQRISIRADQNNLTLDFRLVRMPAVTVRGSTATKENARTPRVNVTLHMAGDSTGAARYATRSNDLGAFEIENVAPGSYIASAETIVGTERYSASKHIVIYDRDENNVGLILSSGIPVIGKLSLDTGGPLDIGSAHAGLISMDASLESFASGFQPDGRFAIENVQPGAYSLDIRGFPEDLYIKSESSGQTNFMGSTFNLAWESPALLEILLASDGGRLNGNVIDRAGQPFAGAQLVLMPAADRQDRPDQYRISTSDEDGRFEIRGIPPGEYQLFAWEDLEDHAWLNPEWMRTYRGMGTVVTIAANARGSVQVPLIPEK